MNKRLTAHDTRCAAHDARRTNDNNQAQSVLEYTIVLGVIVVVVFAMSPFLRRGLQGFIKVTADQVGFQANGDQLFDDAGHMEQSLVLTRTGLNTVRIDRLGNVGFIFGDIVDTGTITDINLGFTPDNPY